MVNGIKAILGLLGSWVMNAYRELLATPGVPRLMASVIPGRLAYAMINLSTYFFVHAHTGSITIAALATGAETIASSLTAGIRGQAIDRYGQTWPLSVMVPGWTSLVALLSTQHTSTHMVINCAFIGLFSPPINLSARPLWRAAVNTDNLRTAFAADATASNAITVIGPFLATYLALNVSPSTALFTTSSLMVVGGLSMITMPLSRNWRPTAEATAVAELLRNRAFQMLAIEAMIFGVGWGMLEVSVPSFSTLMHQPHLAAPLLGTLAGASIVGGLVMGGRNIPITPLRGFVRASIIAAVATVPLAATTPGWSMGVVLAIIGLCIGFSQVYHWEVVEAVRPPGAAASAQAWIWTAEGSMLALGTSIGGYLVEHVNPRVALGGTTVFLLAGALFIAHIAQPHWAAADQALTDLQVADALADTETSA
jgi:MFS family permease